jgi:hypothetical protein
VFCEPNRTQCILFVSVMRVMRAGPLSRGLFQKEPSVLFCEPNRAQYILLVSVMRVLRAGPLSRGILHGHVRVLTPTKAALPMGSWSVVY